MVGEMQIESFCYKSSKDFHVTYRLSYSLDLDLKVGKSYFVCFRLVHKNRKTQTQVLVFQYDFHGISCERQKRRKENMEK